MISTIFLLSESKSFLLYLDELYSCAIRRSPLWKLRSTIPLEIVNSAICVREAVQVS
jgi:hypothetical protein